MTSRRVGLALIVVIGVLGVMGVLAVAFATMARLERRAATQRTQAAKALLLARSGLEDALARLGMGQDAAYGGEDLDGDGVWDAGAETAEQAFRPGRLDTGDCPLEQALRPSFFVRDRTGAGAPPALLGADGRLRGYSGSLSGDAHPRGNAYAIQAGGEDGIHVNGGDLSSDGEHPGTFDTALKRLLSELARELDAAPPPLGDGIAMNDLPVGPADGEALVTLRPRGGWASIAQVRARLGWPASKAEAFAPYLAFSAWRDLKVVRPHLNRIPAVFPVVRSHAEWATLCADPPVAPGPLCTTQRRFNETASSYAPDFERDASGTIVGRAPINLHWLKDRPELLRALLRGLGGRAMRTLKANGPGSALALCVEASLTAGDIEAVVTALSDLGPATTYANTLGWDGTWTIDSREEFDRFVEEHVAFGSEPSLKRDLLKAAFNPDIDTTKGNPNLTLARNLDKGDLFDAGGDAHRYGVEGCFDTPVKRLRALARITDASGRLLARRALACRVMVDRFRLTAQSEFAAGDGGLGRLDVAGDESVFRPPGTAGFLTANTGTAATSGSKMRVFVPGQQMGLAGSDEEGRPFSAGVALQSYPEPQWPPQAGGADCPRPAAWDGNLQLATLTTRYTDLYGAAGTLRFLASWERGFDAEWAGGAFPRFGFAEAAMDPDLMHPGTEGLSLLGTAASSTRVNTLRPDGIFSENFRTPAYLMRGNLTATSSVRHAAVSLWVKPAVPLCNPNGAAGNPKGRDCTFLNLTRMPDAVLRSRTQMFFLVGGFGFAAESPIMDLAQARFGGFLETAARDNLGDDIGYEYLAGVRSRAPLTPGSRRRGGAHQWFLLTYQWNLASTTEADLHRLTVDAGRGDPGVYFPAPPGTPPVAGASEDLTGDSLGTYEGTSTTDSPRRLFLGSTWTSDRICSRGIIYGGIATPIGAANATLDEFALYDLGTDMAQGSTLAANRFIEGRYAKEDDGRWTSALIALPPGSRVVGLDWTLRLPPVDPSDPQDPNRVFYDGADADALLEVLDAAAARPARYVSSTPGRRRNPVGIALPDGRLRLAATIRPRLGDNAFFWGKFNRPLLDSPLLDDITVDWTPPGGPKVLAWEWEKESER